MGRVAPVRSIVLRSCRPPRWLFVALLFNKVITAWKPGNWVQGSAKHQKHYTHNVLAGLGVWNISKMSIVQDLSSTVTPFMWWWKGKRIRKPRWSNNTINYHPSYQKILTHSCAILRKFLAFLRKFLAFLRILARSFFCHQTHILIFWIHTKHLLGSKRIAWMIEAKVSLKVLYPAHSHTSIPALCHTKANPVESQSVCWNNMQRFVYCKYES